MKRFVTLSTLALFTTIFFASCVKRDVLVIDERYWLSKERGIVAYSSSSCPYYVVETVDGYTVMRNLGYKPYEGDVVYGDLSYYGVHDFYNRTDGSITTGEVMNYWLTYGQAQDIVDYYCY